VINSVAISAIIVGLGFVTLKIVVPRLLIILSAVARGNLETRHPFADHIFLYEIFYGWFLFISLLAKGPGW